ncbi:MAG: DUF4369 domain-containing protein [Prevotellaceae bacterium]|nr:DUF4369 domain-containing protein [Prevotellaceae bacterium]
MSGKSSILDVLYILGALLMVAGALAFLWEKLFACCVYVPGVLLYVITQFLITPQSGSFTLRRLRRQQQFGLFCMLLSAVAMAMLTWDVYRGSFTFRYAHGNAWVVLLLIGALVQLYAAWRIPREIKKESSYTTPKGLKKDSRGLNNPRLLSISAAILTAGLLAASCADQYKLLGTTNIRALEGETIYIKVYDTDDLRKMDSCKVTHGKFEFKGTMDSTVMANLFAGEQSLLPVVLENGEVRVRIDDISQQMSGSPLNDSLYSFIQKKTQIDNQMAELSQKEGRMVMDGMDFDEVVASLNAEYLMLSKQNDELITGFIKRNYNNVLGPGIFMIMTSNYTYPIMTPQIEEILTTATPYFKNHPYVSTYVKMAEENMEKLREQ